VERGYKKTAVPRAATNGAPVQIIAGPDRQRTARLHSRVATKAPTGGLSVRRVPDLTYSIGIKLNKRVLLQALVIQSILVSDETRHDQ
jgi:hypothetical protein